MGKLSVCLVLMASAWWCLTGAGAQETAGGTIFSKNRQFRIPFNTGSGTVRLKQLQLFVSIDSGRSWQPSATAAPDQGQFRFSTDRDGFFWFTVQTTDLEGRLYPANLETAAPSLKVVIDTQPPIVSLQGLTPRQGEIGVSWDIRDDNLDLAATDAILLEYRPAGASTWVPVRAQAGANQAFWNPGSGGPIEVRLRARDRAGNIGEATLPLGGNGAFVNNNQGTIPPAVQGVGPLQGDAAQPILNGPREGERKLVGSKRISLNYEIKEAGPSGVSTIELWYTQDGRSWNKYLHGPGDAPTKTNIVFNVEAEGTYGITLLAKSGVGLGERPPQIGDRPQFWIEVDTTKPVVEIRNVMVGTGADKGKLSIAWVASDKNLHSHPIKLQYAQDRAGPWLPIADRLPNNGRYVWVMPPEVPYEFHLKIEALDRAGNIGEAVTESLIKVDLAQPKVKILDVGPAGN